MAIEASRIYEHTWERTPWIGKILQEREAKQLAKELAIALYFRAQVGGFTVAERKPKGFYDERTEVNLITQGSTYRAVWHVRQE